MRVLVIGGTGNISREIVRGLLERGNEVTIYNRGQHRDPPPAGARVVHGDRRERETFESTVRALAPEAVIDMISYSPEDAASAVRACSGQVCHFIHCSTVMTYGPPVPQPVCGEEGPLGAQTPYGQAKIAADELLLRAHAETGFPVTIIKPSYTFGPGIPLHRMIGDDGNWIDRMRKRKPILSAEGQLLFQFLPSRDAGDLFALVTGREPMLGQIYNMVNPQAITWDDWHRAAAAAVGVEVEIVNAPQWLLGQIDDRYKGIAGNFGHQQVFSGEKLRRAVPEWKPVTPLVEWMAANIAWMDRHGLVSDSDADPLEDRIIAELRGLPQRVGAGSRAQ
jgi:nucleoside-diphosphate-sugar epimerase